MRVSRAAGLLSLLLAVPALPAFAEDASLPPDLEKTVREFEAAFGAQDASRVGALFDEEGTFINPMGQHAVGREQITAQFRSDFERVLKGVHNELAVERVRLLGDLALLDVRQTLSGGHPPPGAPRPWVAHAVVLARRTDGAWRLLDVRPYFFLHGAGPGGKAPGAQRKAPPPR
ncbi:conserved hypothetical protein [Anaeromyxobacter dehalogenans 2CP-1]|uniref:DUF4440 domain-containing protein n=1 Tax=Anaeromyxobacter dehalogenans (strain ATCC BAA-258 / DSM 21875 / 2CP-1) TaxID=455488 RepID=B8J687_ANAD2|nr:SgcJ/EcaC family oxidoreductase [Anaeromyxobacter dehalogenans]ACL66982.1 conserved hypothetical protein [Anaeromyxobacter dehalogenans 2CP-1]